MSNIYFKQIKTLHSLFIGLAIVLFSILGAKAQTVDIGPPDTTIWCGQPITLTAVTTGVATNPTFTSLTLNSDDEHSPVIDIGFPFEFFGNTYTQCVASSNGYLTFDLTQAGAYSPWSIGGASPTPGIPDNAIMFPWQDINPGAGSGGTNAADCGDGTFIVDYIDISMFSCTTLDFTMQVVLYENTNIIETYITNKPLCTTWNGGAAIHGLENIDGTQAVIVPGRNFPTQWATANDAVRFTPDGFGSYTIDETIPFNPIPVGAESIEWTNAQGAVLSTTTSLTVSPMGPTWYYCTYQSACSTIEVTDSIYITLENPNITADPISPSCVEFTDGGVFINPVSSNLPIAIDIMDPSATVVAQVTGANSAQTLLGLGAGDYTALITDNIGCISNIDFTVIDPEPITFSVVGTLDPSCFEFSNGYAIVESDGLGITPLIFGALDSNGVEISQTIAPFNLDTIHNLPAGDFRLTMIDDIGCTGDSIDITLGQPELLLPNAYHRDILCNGADNGIAAAFPTGGTAPYVLLWDDPLEQTTDSIEFLPPGAYNVTVVDAQNCVSDTTLSVEQPLPLISDITVGSDTCLLHNGAILTQMQGGTPPYTYIWSAIRDSAHFEIDSTNHWNLLSGLTHGDYTLLLVDSNGCELEDAASVPLISPPIAAFSSRSKPEEFIDPYVQFINESQAAQTYEWLFGDGNISYDEDPEHKYDTSGVFLVMQIAYNDPIFGCADTTFGYVEVTPMFTFYVPSGFTPDDDELNDTWGPSGQSFEYESYNVQVYDRWGTLIWQTDNPDVKWNGTYSESDEEVKQGLYIYIFTLKKFNTFEPKVIKGTVTLYRNN